MDCGLCTVHDHESLWLTLRLGVALVLSIRVDVPAHRDPGNRDAPVIDTIAILREVVGGAESAKGPNRHFCVLKSRQNVIRFVFNTEFCDAIDLFGVT